MNINFIDHRARSLKADETMHDKKRNHEVNTKTDADLPECR